MTAFKAYDIRGRYPEEINEDLFQQIGLAACPVFDAATVVVGRDMRESSDGLAAALIQGLTQAGAKVTDIGMVSTPMMYFGTAACRADLGIQVTASHNGAGFNGAKFCGKDAIPISYETGLAEIEKTVSAGSVVPGRGEGGVKERDIGPDYRAHLLKFADQIEPLSVVVDAGNGVMGAFLPDLFTKLPCELIRLYFEPDGSFPNHDANPLRQENLQSLIQKVRESEADLGVAFDGDGDRCCFVDNQGVAIPADHITALLAGEVLAREPGGTVLYDLRSSRVCPEEIERLGGVPLMTRVGHSFVKQAMREHDAVFGGELSGHYYFRDTYCADNAEMALLSVMSLISRSGQSLSELLAPYNRYFATGEINFEVEDTGAALERLEEALGGEAEEVQHVDGVSILATDWWCNLRPSNTESLLRLNLEAKTAELRDTMSQRVQELIAG